MGPLQQYKDTVSWPSTSLWHTQKYILKFGNKFNAPNEYPKVKPNQNKNHSKQSLDLKIKN